MKQEFLTDESSIDGYNFQNLVDKESLEKNIRAVTLLITGLGVAGVTQSPELGGAVAVPFGVATAYLSKLISDTQKEIKTYLKKYYPDEKY